MKRLLLVLLLFMQLLLPCPTVWAVEQGPEIVCLYDERTPWSDLRAQPVNGQAVAGTFVVPEGKKMVLFAVVNIPSGGPAYTSSYQVKIYPWTGNYAASVAETPVFVSDPIEDIADNQGHYLPVGGIPSGSYLWVLEIDSGYAPWVVPSGPTAAESVCYFDGTPISGWYRVCVMFRPADYSSGGNGGGASVDDTGTGDADTGDGSSSRDKADEHNPPSSDPYAASIVLLLGVSICCLLPFGRKKPER